MRKISLQENIILLKNIYEDTPIFAKRENEFYGMIIKEEAGWILRVGGDLGSAGYYKTRKECMETEGDEVTFFVPNRFLID